MPTVPIIPTVGQDPVRGAQFQAGQVAPVVAQQPQMLQQAGQAMERSGEQWQQLEAMQRRRVDIAAHTERLAAIGEQDTNWLVDGQRLQGKAAVESFDGRLKDLDKRYKAALESAPEGQQRDWLRRELAEKRHSLFNAAISHREKELLTWRKGSTAAAATQAEKTAIAMMDAEDRQDYINKAIAANMEAAEVQGLSDDERNLMVKGSLARIHGESIRALIQGERMGEAAAYLDKHRLDLDPTQRPDFEALVKAGIIDQAASNLTQTVPSFAERLRLVDEMPGLSDDDRASAKRALRQKANEEDANNAQIAQDVEQRLNAYYAANPNKELADNPALLQEVTQYGINPARTRVTDNRYFQQVYSDDDAGKLIREELRSLNPAQLHLRLSQRLNSHDESQLTAFLRGDQSLASIKERTTMLARSIGYLPEGADKATPDQTRAFTAWVANTIDPIVAAQRDKLGRDLNVEEFQKLVVDPIKNDKAMLRATDLGVDWTDKDWGPFPMETMRLKGYAPIDNPDTQEDESLNFDKYKDLYVDVEGQQVFLYEIPMEERKNIRDAWSLNPANRGRFLSAADEAREWVKAGRRGDRKLETTKESPSYQGVMDPAEFPVQVGASRLDHIWSDGKSIRQGSTAYPGYKPPKK